MSMTPSVSPKAAFTRGPLAAEHDATAVGAVLCAGLGTRLRPATDVTPKPAVPFLGLALAMHSMEAMERAGLQVFGANTHYLPDAMRTALVPLEARGRTLRVTTEDGEILGTGGGTREIWKSIGAKKALVVCHGDVVLGADLAPIIAAHRAAHRATGVLATLVLKVRDGSTSLRGVFTDQTGHVAQIIGQRSPHIAEPVVEHAFTGIQILEPELFERIPSEGPYCLVTQLFQRLLASGVPIGAHLTTAFYADLGTYERYLDAQRRVLDMPSLLPGLAWPAEQAPQIWVGERVVIEEGARVVGPVVLKDDVVIAPGASVGPYAVLSGTVRVHSGVRVENASVWGSGDVRADVVDGLLASVGQEG